MKTPSNEITATLWAQYTWIHHEGPNPVTCQSAEEWEAQTQAANCACEVPMAEVVSAAPSFGEIIGKLHGQFGEKLRVKQQREQHASRLRSSWPGWYEPRDMIAIALGAPEPLRLNDMWWHDRQHYVLEHIESIPELAKLPVPEWSRVDCVQRMLDSRERWQHAHPEEPPANFGVIWDHLAVPGQGEVSVICYPSFVDLGIYLMGATHFLTILGGEPELADAFMDFCFELSTGYIDFLHALQPEPFVGMCSFGGDATFYLSPTLYERYSAGWDAWLFDYVRAKYGLADNAPNNLHSCGASSHLYEAWGKHPCRKTITAMQTRLIPGTVGRLRAALPATELELTLHPPEFDLASAEPDEIRAILRQSADAAGGGNVHFFFITAIHQLAEMPKLAANTEVVLEEIEALRS